MQLYRSAMSVPENEIPSSDVLMSQVQSLIYEKSTDAAESGLLQLRKDLAGYAEKAPEACRDLLLKAVLPVLQEARDELEPVRIAFDILLARFEEDGKDLFESSIDRALSLGLKALAARGLAEWGYWNVSQGRLAEAESYIVRAQLIFRELSQQEDLEELYLTRTQIAMRSLSWESASKKIQAWLQDVNSTRIIGQLKLELAFCAMHAQNPIAADELLTQASRLFLATGQLFGLQLAKVYRARWFWYMGALQRAYSLFSEAEQWFSTKGYDAYAQVIEANRAAVQIAANESLQEASTTLNRLCRRLKQPDPLIRWQLTMNLAAAYERLGQYEEASGVYEQLKQLEQVRAWEAKVAVLNWMHLKVEMGDAESLETYLRRALNDPVIRGHQVLHFLALANMGDWCRNNRAYRMAGGYYRSAIEELETARLQLPWEFLRRQIRARRTKVFCSLERLLLTQHCWQEAWEASDFATSQSLRDFTQEAYPNLKHEDLLRLLKWRRHLARAHREVESNCPDSDGVSEASPAAVELDRMECLVEETLDAAKRTYRSKSEESTWLSWYQGLSSDIALLQFTRRGSELGVYTVRQGKARYHALRAADDLNALNRESRTFWRRQNILNQTPIQIESWQCHSGQWSRMILDPLWADLEGVRQLMIVPTDELSLLPWAGLWDAHRGCFLGDLFPDGIVMVPGARIAGSLAERPSSAEGDHVVVARPGANLPFTDYESSWVARNFGGQLLLNHQVTWSRMRRLLPRCSWLHYTGHGRFNARRPMASHLQLARGQRWTGWDMVLWPLPGTVVVLSACELASTQVAPEGEWLGLLRGLFMAGARSVVASLWEVSDLASVPLMQSFYRHVLKTGGDLATALNQAQQQMRHLGHWGRQALCKSPSIDDQRPWEELVDPDASPLLSTESRDASVQWLCVLRQAMQCWRQVAPGRYGNNRQCRVQIRRFMEELSRLEHPRYWSSFQVYGTSKVGLPGGLTQK